MKASLSSSHLDSKQHVNKQRAVGHPFVSEIHPRPLHLVVPEGQIQVHTAPYRGSFSGVLSEALRAAGLGRRVLVAQLLKGGVSQGPTGKVNLCGRLEWLRPAISSCLVEKFDDHTSKESQASALNAVKEIWEICKERLLSGSLDQLVLDEVGLAIHLGYLNESDLINTLERRPGAMDVILTGPAIPSRVIGMADQVTELRSGH